MLQAAVSFVWPDVSTNISMQGEFERLPPQSRTFRLTPTSDGYVAMITVTTPQWNGMLRAVGRDDLVGHPDYDAPQARGRNGGPLMREVRAHFASLTTAEVTARLTAQGVPNSAVTAVDDLADVVDRTAPGYLVREVHPVIGDVLHPGPAVVFDEPVTVRPAPDLGEHTDEIKAELAR
jgi:formyl-CoA transferase